MTLAAYDFNFCFPVPEVLENNRVRLVPFNPHIHSEKLLKKLESYPEVFEYLPYGPFKTIEEYGLFLKTRVQGDPGTLFFAVYDKTKADLSNSEKDDDDGGNGGVGAGAGGGGALLAGSIAFLNSSATNLAVEIGHIITLPPFQRTHVTSNAIGLLMHYALDVPSERGLGLRRVVWQANALNKRSIGTAQRMGFKMEGILRWDRVLPLGKESASNGRVGRGKEDPRMGCVGRDTAMLSHCWDDWEGGGRQRVGEIMARAS
ncbi:hypothetical protein AX17_001565 [Amanita inopinata Kibby_2008]|nr:hypothetical protein AX17_001565 [Amanita inopinata Kibby_2008]